jgi:hypothetical protein
MALRRVLVSTFPITAFLRQLPEIGSLCDAMLDANLLTVCRSRDS